MPGAGKTTQTQILGEFLGCPWFSMGGLIRQYATGQARAQMLQGKIIDDGPTMQILAKALEPINTAKDECIVEGNPRSIPQAKWWLAKIKSGQIKLTGILQLSIGITDAEHRLKKRGRVDDSDINVIHKRFEEYKRTITPTIDYLKEQGLTVHEIDGSGTVEEVALAIKSSLGLKGR
ncbi:MAG: nucleoside monophosphate kinase [Candidatus Saccharimonadales bacterium]|jgi:adenylate kinase family enzyme